MKINFMIAGVQKGGTTAMYETLRRHPAIGMPRRKEPHFFDRDERNWDAPDYERLHRLYEPGCAVYGESTPITLFWTSTHERIRAYNPEMKLILLFRDPIDRAFSHWCMQFARGREKMSFADAIRHGRERTQAEPRRFSYVERGFYGIQLLSLRKIFPEKQMLLLLSEHFLTDRKATLARIANFIGVDTDSFAEEEILARTKKGISYPSIVTEADREYLRELYESDLERFVQISNLDIAGWSSRRTRICN